MLGVFNYSTMYFRKQLLGIYFVHILRLGTGLVVCLREGSIV